MDSRLRGNDEERSGNNYMRHSASDTESIINNVTNHQSMDSRLRGNDEERSGNNYMRHSAGDAESMTAKDYGQCKSLNMVIPHLMRNLSFIKYKSFSK